MIIPSQIGAIITWYVKYHKIGLQSQGIGKMWKPRLHTFLDETSENLKFFH